MRFLVTGLLMLVCGATLAAPDLADILKDEHRSAEHIARDKYRNPRATLEFFGLKPTMTVVEVWPAPGYYTEVLAPYLRDKGRYYAAGFALAEEITPAWRHEVHAKYLAKLKSDPGRYDRVRVTALGPQEAWQPAPTGSADLMLTFRNVHNWMKGDYEREMFDAFYKALKPGGVLGVVEHRAKPDTSRQWMVDSGYVTEAYVIELAELAGFKLQAKSEVNANPRDDTLHEKGVWTLPPSLRLGDKDRAKYLAIGESDRMTLKFVKPQ